MEVRRRAVNVVMFVLASSYLSRQDATTVHTFEVPVGECVAFFCVLGLLVVDTQIPLRVCAEPLVFDERVFLLCRRLMLAPLVALIQRNTPFLDQLLRMLERALVQFLSPSLRSPIFIRP